MPILLYVGLTFVLLNIITSMYNKNNNEYVELKEQYEKTQNKDKINKLEENILSFYNNHYGEIHENYVQSNTINLFSNINGNLNEFYLFNSDKLCKYTNKNLTTTGEKTDVSTIVIENDKLKQIDMNKNIDCNINYDDFVTSLTLEQKLLMNDFKNVIGNSHFIRIDIESVKDFKTISLPVLNFYLYESNKQLKPNLFTEQRLNSDIIVAKKIDESKILLEQISNNLSEFGKRRFKGFTKLKTYSNVNAFSNLAEGYMYSDSTGKYIYGLISLNSSSGFQTGSLMAFHTRYLKSGTINKIDNLISDKWKNFIVDCNFVDSAFNVNNTLDWYSENSYYSCSLRQNNSLSLVDEIKPLGYCSLSDMCSLVYTFDNYGKIETMNSLTLHDFFIDSEYGLNLDMSKFKNPFFPNESILDNDNFILSSSNGNQITENGISINFGLKIVNRDPNIKNLTLYTNKDLEKNYIINKYFINY